MRMRPFVGSCPPSSLFACSLLGRRRWWCIPPSTGLHRPTPESSLSLNYLTVALLSPLVSEAHGKHDLTFPPITFWSFVPWRGTVWKHRTGRDGFTQPFQPCDRGEPCSLHSRAMKSHKEWAWSLCLMRDVNARASKR
jgi:hypothetical protein